jgi:hypothetical protein
MQPHLFFFLFPAFFLFPNAPLQAADSLQPPKTETAGTTLPSPANAGSERTPEKKQFPNLEFHADFRWLYGKGRFTAHVPDFRHNRWKRREGEIYRSQRRLRLYPNIHTSADTTLKFMLEDKRDSKDPSDEHHLSLSRFYLESRNEHSKWEVGRFNYYLLDGNVIDKRVDGVRANFGSSRDPAGRLTLYAGRTTGKDSLHRKRGWSVLYDRRGEKFRARTAYLDFRNEDSHPASFPGLAPLGIKSGRSGSGFDRQQIWETLLEYRPVPRWNLSLDLLQSWGKQEADHYSENERGFVAAVTYGQLDEQKQGTWETWLRYYDQPQSSILYHTMDGDTHFFQRMGFKGWGVRMDYVVIPGLVWAVEGFALKNRKTGNLTKGFREYVLGTSMTAYF